MSEAYELNIWVCEHVEKVQTEASDSHTQGMCLGRSAMPHESCCIHLVPLFSLICDHHL